MKVKKINPGEPFQLGDNVYTYSLNEDGNIVLSHYTGKTPKKNSFTPPTLEEVTAYFKEKGFNHIGAKKAFDYYEAGEWKDSKGNQVKNWKQKMFGVWMRDEYKIQEQKATKQVHSSFFQQDNG